MSPCVVVLHGWTGCLTFREPRSLW